MKLNNKIHESKTKNPQTVMPTMSGVLHASQRGKPSLVDINNFSHTKGIESLPQTLYL